MPDIPPAPFDQDALRERLDHPAVPRPGPPPPDGEALASILNRFRHRDHDGWHVDGETILGEDPHEWLTRFEAEAIARAYLGSASLPHPASAPFEPGPRKFIVTHVHDGDTFDGYLLQEPPISIRMVKIDAPEMSDPVGLAARQYLDHLIGGKVVVVDLTGKMSFERFLAGVSSDGVDISAAMLAAGHARPMGPHGEHLPESGIPAP